MWPHTGSGTWWQWSALIGIMATTLCHHNALACPGQDKYNCLPYSRIRSKYQPFISDVISFNMKITHLFNPGHTEHYIIIRQSIPWYYQPDPFLTSYLFASINLIDFLSELSVHTEQWGNWYPHWHTRHTTHAWEYSSWELAKCYMMMMTFHFKRPIKLSNITIRVGVIYSPDKWEVRGHVLFWG